MKKFLMFLVAALCAVTMSAQVKSNTSFVKHGIVYADLSTIIKQADKEDYKKSGVKESDYGINPLIKAENTQNCERDFTFIHYSEATAYKTKVAKHFGRAYIPYWEINYTLEGLVVLTIAVTSNIPCDQLVWPSQYE